MSSVRSRMTHRLTRERVMLEIRRARGPFVVLAAMAVVAIASLAFLLSQLRSGLPGSDRYEVRVAVDDAAGVIPGKQEVRISGVAVGTIAGVELAAGRPVLRLAIERRYAPVYRDARVRLRPRTPLDDLYLDVESRGHVNAGRLEPGRTLSAQRTRTRVAIGRVLDVFDADTRPRVKQAINALGRGLDDRGQHLRAAITEISPFLRAAQRLSRELATRRGHTRRLVHNLRLLTEELGHRETDLDRLVRGGADTLTAVGTVDASLSATLGALPSTLRRLQSAFAVLRSTADELDPALDALQPTAAAMPAGLYGLRRLTRDALPAVTALRGPVRRLAPLMRRLRPTAADLDHAFAALLPQAPRLDRITGMVVPCELAVQKFLQHTLSVGKFQGRVAFPRGQIVGGVNSLGGVVNDASQQAGRSCAPGGPRK